MIFHDPNQIVVAAIKHSWKKYGSLFMAALSWLIFT